jgi:two-component system, OmpR family, sensor kinase
MWSIEHVPGWVKRISIRWRLTLAYVGLLTLLLGGLGIIILITAQNALLSNEATALRHEASLAVNGIRGHPFVITRAPGPPPADMTKDLQRPAEILVQRLAGANANATLLSQQGSVLLSDSNLPMTPPQVILSPALIQQSLASDTQDNSYRLASDAQGKRQVVVLMPLVSQYRTVAILQLSSPTSTADAFLTTLRIILLFGGIGALAIAIALIFPLIGAALQPLVEMERASRRIAEGALSMRLQIPHSNDEIGHLALSFNRMVAQLESAFRRQKQFVADVSHELRTPLTALSGGLEMLVIGADRGDIEAARRLARGMYTEVQRMHRLVEDLLALTRLDEGKIELRADTVDVRSVIEKVYEQAQQLTRGQEIRKELSQDIPLVCADSDRLLQVLLIVVDNALKFTADDGAITLAARGEGRAAAIILILDNGIGIPSEALPHVFDRFYRADPARSRQAQRDSGNGLGLAIARELIEALGGTISISSQPGEGSSVMIRLRAISTASGLQEQQGQAQPK